VVSEEREKKVLERTRKRGKLGRDLWPSVVSWRKILPAGGVSRGGTDLTKVQILETLRRQRLRNPTKKVFWSARHKVTGKCPRDTRTAN